MSLELKITEDLKTAMRAKDQAALRSIRSIKAELLKAKTDGTGREIDEAREVQMLQKMVKQRKESAEIFEKQNRLDLAGPELEEIAIIEKYLPQMMTVEEITAVLKGIITEVGATSGKDMGKVMGVATKQLAGKADGKLVSETVKSLLA
jgi:uncharacterized protein YqeY